MILNYSLCLSNISVSLRIPLHKSDVLPLSALLKPLHPAPRLSMLFSDLYLCVYIESPLNHLHTLQNHFISCFHIQICPICITGKKECCWNSTIIHSLIESLSLLLWCCSLFNHFPSQIPHHDADVFTKASCFSFVKIAERIDTFCNSTASKLIRTYTPYCRCCSHLHTQASLHPPKHTCNSQSVISHYLEAKAKIKHAHEQMRSTSLFKSHKVHIPWHCLGLPTGQSSSTRERGVGSGDVVNTNNQLYVQYNYRQINCTMAYTESSRLIHLPRGKLWRSKLLCFFVPAQQKCSESRFSKKKYFTARGWSFEQ